MEIFYFPFWKIKKQWKRLLIICGQADAQVYRLAHNLTHNLSTTLHTFTTD